MRAVAQMCAVPDRSDSGEAVDWANLDGRLLCDTREHQDNRPVLSCTSAASEFTVTPDGFVLFPRSGIVEAETTVPPTSFSKSGQALLGGKMPLVRLAVRAVHMGAESGTMRAVEGVRGTVSTSFYVTTTRTRHNKKPPVPTTVDLVRLLRHRLTRFQARSQPCRTQTPRCASSDDIRKP
jgi:hypothetical protein